MGALYKMYTVLAISAVLVSAPAALGQGGSQPFKLGAETDQYNAGSTYPAYPSYPSPQMVPQQPKLVPPPQQRPPMKAAVQQTAPQQRPMQAAVQTSPPPGVLPGQFMGPWHVTGQRVQVQGSTPQYQAGYERVFGVTTHNTWNIAGNPGSYGISSDGGMQQIQLGQITASTAFFRYQHPVYMNQNGQMVAMPTVAQEAVVMQASPDGRNFVGKLRITLVKPGEPQPRGVVSYDLAGQR